MKIKNLLLLMFSVAFLFGCATETSVETPVHTGKQFQLDQEHFSGMYKWTDVQDRISKSTFIYPTYQQTGYNLLLTVDKEVNTIKYVSDKQNYGVEDYWATPGEFFIRGGDCEDYAITKYEILKHNGFPADDMKLVLGWSVLNHQFHTVLFATIDGKTFVLTNGNHLGGLFPVESYLKIFNPIYAINDNNLWMYK